MTQRGMLEADVGSEGGDGGSVIRGQWWGTAEVSRGFGGSGGFGSSSQGCSANP